MNFDDFMEQAFMQVKTNCLNCGKEMVYEPSLNLAKSKGVTENALINLQLCLLVWLDD